MMALKGFGVCDGRVGGCGHACCCMRWGWLVGCAAPPSLRALAAQGLELLQPAWAPGSDALAVPSSGGALWLLEPTSGAVLAAADGRSGGWGSSGRLAGAAAALRGGQLHVLALSNSAALHLLAYHPTERALAPACRPVSLHPHHRAPHCLVYDAPRNRLLVAGDGPGLQGGASGKRVSLSVWQLLEGPPTLRLAAASGPPGVGGLLSGLLPAKADPTGAPGLICPRHASLPAHTHPPPMLTLWLSVNDCTTHR